MVLPKLKARGDREQNEKAKEMVADVGPAVRAAAIEPRNVLSRLIRSRAWTLRFVGLLLACIIGFLVVWWPWRQEKPAERQKQISLRPLTSFAGENPVDYAGVSPDGKYLAFCSTGKLFIQIVSSGEKRSVSLPEGFGLAAVGWFPDGTKLLLRRSEERWIRVKGEETFIIEESLWSLSILGGTPQKIVDHARGSICFVFGWPISIRRMGRS